MAKKKVKKRKIKARNLLIFFFVLAVSVLGIMYLYNLKISNIIVKNNTLYTDWQIIKLAGLDNYPPSMETLPSSISKKLKKDPYIKNVKVQKKMFTEIIITIEENLPLFYYEPNQKTVLADKTEVDDNFPVPTLVNYVPNKLYSKFLTKMNELDYTILKRISEIKYDPNEVDEERFLLMMNDGNNVYLTLYKYDKLNNYLEIIKEFNNKKGILYLDSGEYFKVFEN